MSDASRVPGGWKGFWLGIAVTAALVGGAAAAWPQDHPGHGDSATPTVPTTVYGTPDLGTGTAASVPGPADTPTGGTRQLFVEGLPEAVGAALAEQGQPAQLQQLTIYPTYVTVDAGDPSNPAGAFTLGEVDLTLIPQLVSDAPSRYDHSVHVTHVIVNRFLPFDQRVLVRVYVQGESGPTSGGYVSYVASDGRFVKVCC